MTAFDRAWDLVKIVPNLMGSDESWHNRYQELMGEPIVGETRLIACVKLPLIN